jgi:deoxycytidylate deaminase
MSFDPFSAMQAAVDIVNDSPHDTNKIAAAVFGRDQAGTPFCHAAFNHWPAPIAAHFPTHAQIGNSSGTVHAETVCILAAPVTEGAQICVTDPFCPNCAKNIAEAGIKHIYIDHKGFMKDFAERRGSDFERLSLAVASHAGIAVSVVYRKEGKINPLVVIPPEAARQGPLPLTLTPAGSFDPAALIAAARAIPDTTPFAVAHVTDTKGMPHILISTAHASAGYDDQDKPTGTKYTTIMEPVNRLMIGARRLGVRIDPQLVVSSRVPTAREQVNMVAAGLTRLHILHPEQARDPSGIQALQQLVTAQIINLV